MYQDDYLLFSRESIEIMARIIKSRHQRMCINGNFTFCQFREAARQPLNGFRLMVLHYNDFQRRHTHGDKAPCLISWRDLLGAEIAQGLLLMQNGWDGQSEVDLEAVKNLDSACPVLNSDQAVSQ